MTPIWVSVGPIGKALAILVAKPRILAQLAYPPGADTILVDWSRMRMMSATAGH